MIRKQQFDMILKNNIQEESKFGYVTYKTYETYVSKSAFQAFIEDMKNGYPSIYENYDTGNGNELSEKKVRGKQVPPKMASVASSSRFCYLALRDGASALGSKGEVCFEKGLPIAGVLSNIHPQLDAAVETDALYIEVKCHEIFDPHRIQLKKKYWDNLFGTGNAFGFPSTPCCKEEEFTIPLTEFGITTESSMFDIKQLLCHLMGVASVGSKPKKLFYLFFKPKCKDPQTHAQIEEVFEALQQEIKCIFDSQPIRKYCAANSIQLAAYAEYAEQMESLTLHNRISIY